MTPSHLWLNSQKRALWLGVNLLTAVLASLVIFLFQDTLDQVVYLAVLMPIVANMGGVAGVQTLTLVIRGLALGHQLRKFSLASGERTGRCRDKRSAVGAGYFSGRIPLVSGLTAVLHHCRNHGDQSGHCGTGWRLFASYTETTGY